MKYRFYFYPSGNDCNAPYLLAQLLESMQTKALSEEWHMPVDWDPYTDLKSKFGGRRSQGPSVKALLHQTECPNQNYILRIIVWYIYATPSKAGSVIQTALFESPSPRGCNSSSMIMHSHQMNQGSRLRAGGLPVWAGAMRGSGIHPGRRPLTHWRQ